MARGARGGKTGQGRANQVPKTKGAKGALKGGEHFLLLFWAFLGLRSLLGARIGARFF